MKTKGVAGKIVCLTVLAFFSLASCTTLVYIETNVPAEVTINGQPVGKTPFQKELSDFIGDNYYVVITADGYITFSGRLQKEFKIDSFIAGCFLLFPWLWVYGPAPYQYFVLQES